MHSLVQPDAWVALKLPNGLLRVLQVTPNTTISLGKYGSFPSNLIIHRPYHLTYELQDKREGENFNRLRIVPAAELYSDILTPSTSSVSPETSTPAPEDEDGENAAPNAYEYSLVDQKSGAVVAKTNDAQLDMSARQTLSMDEIESLKKDGTDAGKAIIAKLMLSHTALDQKTEYSLAKYKLLKTKKYIRRFSVLPLDVPLLDSWLLEDKDPLKIMDMREEMLALLGCWANVHFGGEDRREDDEYHRGDGDTTETTSQAPGRWLIVDDTGGLLVAAMAERMGVLYSPKKGDSLEAYMEAQNAPKRRRESATGSKPVTQDTIMEKRQEQSGNAASETKDVEMTDFIPAAPDVKTEEPSEDGTVVKTEVQEDPEANGIKNPTQDIKRKRNSVNVPYADTNTLTVIHANSQPNLSFLRHYDFDITSPTQPLSHPLTSHLMTLSWLQLLDPASDTTYLSQPPHVPAEELRSWKSSRRGNHYRKLRRWTRIRHIVDSARAGGFSGLVVASSMDPVSILRHTVPLLAGGAPIAIYSPNIEPLTALADCYSVARRGAWVSNPPEEVEGKTLEELENWAGTDEFPLNPTLVLGAAIQTSRARKWQVLPGRTHPLMTSKGGAEGYIFTGWRVKPAEGKVEARGKGQRRKKQNGD